MGYDAMLRRSAVTLHMMWKHFVYAQHDIYNMFSLCTAQLCCLCHAYTAAAQQPCGPHDLQAAVEGKQPLYLELARYLAAGTDTLTDPAFEVYHGLAAVHVAEQLSEPGQMVAKLQAVVTMAYLEAQQAGTLTQPGLPRPDPPTNAKVRHSFVCFVKACVVCYKESLLLQHCSQLWHCQSVCTSSAACFCTVCCLACDSYLALPMSQSKSELCEFVSDDALAQCDAIFRKRLIGSVQAKPIEEAPAAVTDGSTPVCAWAKAQTSITATLQLQTPLYPPWQPPPLPAVTLQQLIPKREFVKKEMRPTASQVFQAQVQAAVKQLALDYQKVSPQQSRVCLVSLLLPQLLALFV